MESNGRLQWIDLHNNKLSGPLPTSWASAPLSTCDLSQTELCYVHGSSLSCKGVKACDTPPAPVESGLSSIAIIGIVVGVLFVFALIIKVVQYNYRLSQAKLEKNSLPVHQLATSEPPAEMPASTHVQYKAFRPVEMNTNNDYSSDPMYGQNNSTMPTQYYQYEQPYQGDPSLVNQEYYPADPNMMNQEYYQVDPNSVNGQYHQGDLNGANGQYHQGDLNSVNGQYHQGNSKVVNQPANRVNEQDIEDFVAGPGMFNSPSLPQSEHMKQVQGIPSSRSQ